MRRESMVPIPPRRRGRALFTFAVVVALMMSACTDSPTASPTTRPRPTKTPSAPPTTPDNGGTKAKFPLGTLTASTDPASCGNQPQCRIGFEVTCPDVQQPARGTLVVLPADQPRGMVMILLGGLGTGFEGVNRMFVRTLQGDGMDVVILSWDDTWLGSAPGESIGPKRLACRSATTIAWTHDNLYKPLNVSAPATGACGFCLHGNSAGSSQIAYALSFYGLAPMVNGAILSGGPPHAAMQKGCLQEKGYGYDRIEASTIDLSYGYPNGGPCLAGDSSWTDTWEKDGVDSGGVYSFPETRIAFIFVEGDPTPGPAHGAFYLDKLEEAKTPYLSHIEIPGNAHTIESMPNGRAALEEAVMGSAAG